LTRDPGCTTMTQVIAAPPRLLMVGPAHHGVVQYAIDVARAAVVLDPRASRVDAPTPADAVHLLDQVDRAHVHVTDRLFGRSPEEAAETVEHLAGLTELTVTLHDVPQTSDGRMLDRRIAAYARFIQAARATAVNSHHEQSLIEEFLGLGTATVPHAIPLGSRIASAPMVVDEASREGAARPLAVLIAGFIYPGKGHSAAIQAASRAADDLRAGGHPVGEVVVRAIGGPSAGHEDDVLALEAEARAVGVSFEVTGYLDDVAFGAQISHPGIPLAAHGHVSASRSMLDWVEAGRRPLVVDSRYAAEMERLRPETMVRYDPSTLHTELAAAWLDPSRTRLPAGRSLRPALPDTAQAYLDWWAGR
jgi:hypothetical protein